MFFRKKPKDEPAEDHHLIHQVKQGKAEAFGMLYQRYAKCIYRFIFFKVSTTSEAEDLTQETFIKAYKKLDQFTSGSFQAWLYTIARHTVVDHWRKNGRKKELSFTFLESFQQEGDNRPLDPEDSQAENLLEKLSHQSSIDAIKFSLQKLKPHYRKMIEMRFIADLSISEVSKLIKHNETWVRVNTHRALQKLKELLGNKTGENGFYIELGDRVVRGVSKKKRPEKGEMRIEKRQEKTKNREVDRSSKKKNDERG